MEDAVYQVCGTHLGKEPLHFSHGFAQLLLCVFGSLQCIVSHRHSPVTVQASTVTLPLVVTATRTPTWAFPTRSITRGTTHLPGQVHMS